MDLISHTHHVCLACLAEEFGIYLNYVRKLGFEEAPDYDFLRDLFTKVMKSSGDVDDQVYDWNLLNGTDTVLARMTTLAHTHVQVAKDGSRYW